MRTAAATSREALAQWCGHDALAEPGWHVRGAADVAKLDSLRPGRHRAWHRGRAGVGRHAGTARGSLPAPPGGNPHLPVPFPAR
ncbi:hypothetical protein ACFQ0B_28660 [Nonomuraea thailandensis]